MRVAFMSDLHLEFGNTFIPRNKVKADVLLLAGDIFLANHFDSKPGVAARYHHFLEEVCGKYKHVLYTSGNHEGYNWTDPNADPIAVLTPALERYKNLVHLDNNYVDLFETDDHGMERRVRFLGAPLWTDFDNENLDTIAAAAGGMNDYITWAGNTPWKSLHKHRISKKYIFERLDGDYDAAVVMTHMAPSYKSVAPEFRNGRYGSELNGAYYTALDADVLAANKLKYWVHGHMHHKIDYMIGETRVLGNPYGYFKYAVNPKFDPDASVDV